MVTFYRQQVTIGGDFAMLTAVPVTWRQRVRGEKRRRRQDCKPTREAQQWVNKRNAEERLFLTAHANFGIDDYRLGLDFTDATLPGDLTELKRLMRNFWGRLRTLYKRHGVELKYIWVAERSESGRFHVHGFLPGGVPRGEIEAAWGMGHANCAGFQYDRQGLRGYCNYVLKNPLMGKAWCGSRNLKRPERRQSDYVLRQKDVAAAQAGDFFALEQRLKGWSVLNDWQIEGIQIDEPDRQVTMEWAVTGAELRQNEVNGLPYLYIKLCKRSARLSY